MNWLSSSGTVEAIPYINTCLLFVLAATMAAVVWRRHTATTSLHRQNTMILQALAADRQASGAKDREILDMLKVMVAELRMRPCVVVPVEYKADGPSGPDKPPSSASRKGRA